MTKPKEQNPKEWATDHDREKNTDPKNSHPGEGSNRNVEEDKGKANKRQPQSTRNATHVATGSNNIVRDKALQQ